MKIYKLHSNPYTEMDLEEATDWLQNNCHFKFDYVSSLEETTNQAEMLEKLLEAYFFTEEIEEMEETNEDDIKERLREHRRGQI